jgi:hypothetical protein
MFYVLHITMVKWCFFFVKVLHCVDCFFLGKSWRSFIVHVISVKFGFLKTFSSVFLSHKIEKKSLLMTHLWTMFMFSSFLLFFNDLLIRSKNDNFFVIFKICNFSKIYFNKLPFSLVVRVWIFATKKTTLIRFVSYTHFQNMR